MIKKLFIVLALACTAFAGQITVAIDTSSQTLLEQELITSPRVRI